MGALPVATVLVAIALLLVGVVRPHLLTRGIGNSCHAMEKYGKSLTIDNPRYLPAAHFQNARVPRETACFACHTTYTLYGDLTAKLHGLQHVWVAYLGTVSEHIKLYTPYNNRECLHCHDGTRGFEDNSEHQKERARIQKNELSCLSQGCHPNVHAVDELDKLKLWPGATEAKQ